MSFSEWKEVRLGDICDIVMGQSPKGESCNNIGNGTPLLNGPTEFGLFHPHAIQFTTDVRKQSMKNDLLFCVRGSTTGRMNWADKEYAIGRGLAAIRHKNGSDYIHFVKGLIDYKLDEILNCATGSTFPNVGRDLLNSLNVYIPPIQEQKSIADTLSCIDDKIELNNSTNKTLEEMAQAIFKSWFVDFEPFQDGEFEDSELGMIPTGWRVVELSEIVDIVNGYSYKGSDLKESKNAMMTIKNFDRDGGIRIDGFKEIAISDRVKDRHYVELFDVLVAHTDLTQNAEIIGNPILVLTKSKYEKLIVSMDLVKVVSKIDKISNWIVYSLLKNDSFKHHALGYSAGTTVLHLNKKAIPEYKIALPIDKKVLNEVSLMLEPIYKTISNNLNQNQTLTTIRDTLLPKLMSGEIRVPIEEVK